MLQVQICFDFHKFLHKLSAGFELNIIEQMKLGQQKMKEGVVISMVPHCNIKPNSKFKS